MTKPDWYLVWVIVGIILIFCAVQGVLKMVLR